MLPSPATIPLATPDALAVGPHDRQHDPAGGETAFEDFNDPARWGPPKGAKYLLAVIDPDQQLILPFPGSAEYYRSETVASLQLHTEQEVLQGSVTPLSDDIMAALNKQNDVALNDPGAIGYQFKPGNGTITMSEAEVDLGIDHFNWLQLVTDWPKTWQPVTIVNLDYNRSRTDTTDANGNITSEVINLKVDRDGIMRYTDNGESLEDAGGYYYDINTPFPDPIVTADPSKYTRAYVVTDPTTDIGSVIPFYNDQMAYPPDAYFSYLNDAAEVGAETTSDTLVFWDRPNFGRSAIPEMVNGDGAESFKTRLDGVNYDPNAYPKVWNGYFTNFTWKTNAVGRSGGSGGVFDVVSYLSSPGSPSASRPPIAFGGVFDVQLVSDAGTEQPINFLPVSNLNVLTGQQITVPITADDQFEGRSLRYSVDPGQFPGTIDPTTGVLTGTPTVAGTFPITVTATDDGTPALTGSVTFTVTVIPPSSLSGTVFSDFNDDGQIDFGESGISGVSVQLSGTDDLGHAVDRTLETDGDGAYVFLNIRPGSYYLTRTTQPTGYTPGTDSVGTAGGSPSGTDQFFVQLAQGINGLNYNYGERPAATGPVQKGQTAGIGFWNNKNGQALILALNGGTGTELGDWLAATLPNMYGANAGNNDLAGKSNAYIAALFQQDFLQKGMKLDAQVLATALSVYVTNATLDSTQAAAKYGFTVSGYGLGTATFNVGSNGDAFGVANNTSLTVLDLLRATDAQAVNGVLYNGNTTKRNEANNVYSALNAAGGIG
jgi:hypothetical protein